MLRARKIGSSIQEDVGRGKNVLLYSHCLPGLPDRKIGGNSVTIHDDSSSGRRQQGV